jgi:hypothetical protein
MDFYIVVSLVVVFGLIAWWSFLAISALRNEFVIHEDKDICEETGLHGRDGKLARKGAERNCSR